MGDKSADSYFYNDVRLNLADKILGDTLEYRGGVYRLSDNSCPLTPALSRRGEGDSGAVEYIGQAVNPAPTNKRRLVKPEIGRQRFVIIFGTQHYKWFQHHA